MVKVSFDLSEKPSLQVVNLEAHLYFCPYFHSLAKDPNCQWQVSQSRNGDNR